MTRVIEFSSFLLVIPAMYWQFYNDTAGTNITMLQDLLNHPLGMLIIATGAWIYCFVIGMALWLVCRTYVKIMKILSA